MSVLICHKLNNQKSTSEHLNIDKIPFPSYSKTKHTHMYKITKINRLLKNNRINSASIFQRMDSILFESRMDGWREASRKREKEREK